MTHEEEIAKENKAKENRNKLDPMYGAKEIESKDAPNFPVDKPSIRLDKITPPNVTDTPPAESDRQYAKKVGDYKKIATEAGRLGVDMDNADKMPLMDSNKDKITEAVARAYAKDIANGVTNIADSITAPQNEARAKLDQKTLMESARKQRRATLADALYAFGEGLQGRTANPEVFLGTRLQRQRDKQFQDFKDITERNQKTKYLWENQTRKELVDWADEQANNQAHSAEVRAKFQQVADFHRDDQTNKDEDQIETKRYHTGMLNKSSGSGKLSKDEKPLIVRTEDGVDHKFEPKEVSLYRDEVLSNPDQYPGLFDKVVTPDTESKTSGETIPGRTTFKPRNGVTTSDILRAYLKKNKSSTPVLDKIKAEASQPKKTNSSYKLPGLGK